MAHLTTPSDVKHGTRPISKNLDDERILIFIDEAEQLDIKPRIGDALFIDLLKWVRSEDKTTFPPAYEVLINGGEYVAKGACGEISTNTFKGLKKTLEYYVYAKLVKNNDTSVTRFGGAISKNDDYSQRADLKAKIAAEKDALTVADGYMSDCIRYLISQESISLFVKPGKSKNRLRTSIIGD